ncbi:hypothetical protein ACN9M0_15170 [Streptomyces sp. R-07]
MKAAGSLTAVVVPASDLLLGPHGAAAAADPAPCVRGESETRKPWK